MSCGWGFRPPTHSVGMRSPTVDMCGVVDKLGRESMTADEEELSQVPEGRKSFNQHILRMHRGSRAHAAPRGWRQQPHVNKLGREVGREPSWPPPNVRLNSPEVPALPSFSSGKVDFAQMNRDFERKLNGPASPEVHGSRMPDLLFRPDLHAQSPGSHSSPSLLCGKSELIAVDATDMSAEIAGKTEPGPSKGKSKGKRKSSEGPSAFRESMGTATAPPSLWARSRRSSAAAVNDPLEPEPFGTRSEADEGPCSGVVQSMRDEMAEEVAAAKAESTNVKQQLAEMREQVAGEETDVALLEGQLAEIQRQQLEVEKQVAGLRKPTLQMYMERKSYENTRKAWSCILSNSLQEDALHLHFAIGANVVIAGQMVGQCAMEQRMTRSREPLHITLDCEPQGLLRQLDASKDPFIDLAPGLGIGLCRFAYRRLASNFAFLRADGHKLSESASIGLGNEVQNDEVLVPMTELCRFVPALDHHFRAILELLYDLFELRRRHTEVALVSAWLDDGHPEAHGWPLRVLVTLDVIRSPSDLIGIAIEGVDAARCTVEFSPDLSSVPVDWSNASVRSTRGWAPLEVAAKVVGSKAAHGLPLHEILRAVSEAMFSKPPST